MGKRAFTLQVSVSLLARLVLVAKNLLESLPRADLDTPRHAHWLLFSSSHLCNSSIFSIIDP